jgi:hypothetical protein
VNVLNRYLGYKACKYETKWVSSPNKTAEAAMLGRLF